MHTSSVVLLAIAILITGCTQGSPAGQQTDGVETTPAAGDTTDEPTATTDDAAGDGDQPATGDIEFCLLTADEVGEAFGVEVDDPAEIENPGLGGGCNYTDTEGAPVFAISVVTTDQAEAAFEGYRDYEGSEEISGIGDAALWLGPDFPGVAFLKDGIVYSMAPVSQLLDGDAAALRSATEDLARIAAERA